MATRPRGTLDVQRRRNGQALPNVRLRPVDRDRVQGSPPPIASILARPLLLTSFVILGGFAGFAMWSGGDGYQSSALVEFAAGGGDIGMVQMEAQTLAEKMITEPVIDRAAARLDESPAAIEEATSAKRQPGSYLVEVTATGGTPKIAAARANAVAQAAVDELRNSVLKRVDTATIEANSLLGDPLLNDPNAEEARRTQVGSAIGGRQEGLKGQSESWSVVKPAIEAQPAGVSRALSTAVGNAVGLFAGCLVAVLLGTRGLRVWSAGAVRRLVGGVEVLTPSETPQLAGEIVESGDPYVAVIVTPGASEVAAQFATDLHRLISTHGKTVTIVHAPPTPDKHAASLLRVDAPSNVADLVGTDVVVMVVDEGTESAAMLEGRSGFRSVILMRRAKSRVSDGLWAAGAFGRSRPVMMLAK